MNNLGRTLLLVGAVVLALLIGLVIGRGQRVEPTSEGNAAASVQITTAPPPSAPEPAPTPLPAPVQTPQPAAVPRIAPDLQVQEDAAAVGMTTRESAVETGADAAHSAAAGPAEDTLDPPQG